MGLKLNMSWYRGKSREYAKYSDRLLDTNGLDKNIKSQEQIDAHKLHSRVRDSFQLS